MYPVVLLRPVFFAGSFAAASALTWSMCRLSFRSMFARSKLQSDLLGTGSVRIKSGRATCRYLGAEFSHFPFFSLAMPLQQIGKKEMVNSIRISG
jgi:hypothetical protein